ncbi:conjugal transfer pilus assembly protein TraV [Sphingobium sp. YR768]|nr:conjugal transfer pilus assembly protein TraV [Sphingobium sp. YR768]
MPRQFHPGIKACRAALRALPLFALPLFGLSGCATVGSVMSPYSEKFSCKNSDHGQCIHPDQAYADAVAGRASKSDPTVTNDRKLLASDQKERGRGMNKGSGKPAASSAVPPPAGQRNVGTLIEDPGSPMLRPSRTIRTLILPYADKQRPDRLYMARYVYSIIDRPAWVVGDYLVEPGGRTPAPPVLRTIREREPGTPDAPTGETAPMAVGPEQRP